MSIDPTLSWNLADDISQLFDYQFMVNAYRAGTIVAVTSALAGWFMVLRKQTFAGHTVAIAGFPGASAAVLLGVSVSFGYFAFAIAAALLLALLSSGRRIDDSAAVGTVQALALASGFLFVSLSDRNVAGVQALLFGSFVGTSAEQVMALLVAGLLTVGALAVLARPLLFASIDPDVAGARGVPVPALSVVFLVLLAVAAAEASQVTGALLVFALLVLPAATAEQIASRPAVSLALSVAIALAVTWLSLALSYYSDLPIGFHITTLSFGTYLAVRVWRAAPNLRSSHGRAA